MVNSRQRRTTLLVILAAAGVIAALIGYRFMPGDARLPADFASGNGRIEATEVDVATKLAGRLEAVMVDEGDMVEPGQLLARMDTADLNAQLNEARARLRQAEESRRYAEAVVAQRESELGYAKAELGRMQNLVEQGHVSRESLDQAVTAAGSAEAALRAARVQVVSAEAGIEAARATVERIETSIEDSQLKSPVGGRVLYRLAEPGEVLGAGGKVLTILEVTDVYMTIFLPTAQAGRVVVGSDARIILDAISQYVIPAKVSFVAAEAQFTPKTVETRSEREKLMFRVRIQVDPALLKTYRDRVKTGVPGEAYVRLGQEADWPASLRVKLPGD